MVVRAAAPLRVTSAPAPSEAGDKVPEIACPEGVEEPTVYVTGTETPAEAPAPLGVIMSWPMYVPAGRPAADTRTRSLAGVVPLEDDTVSHGWLLVSVNACAAPLALEIARRPREEEYVPPAVALNDSVAGETSRAAAGAPSVRVTGIVLVAALVAMVTWLV